MPLRWLSDKSEATDIMKSLTSHVQMTGLDLRAIEGGVRKKVSQSVGLLERHLAAGENRWEQVELAGRLCRDPGES